MTAALTTQSLSAAAADSLSWLGDHGFRYFKSYDHFRRKNDNGYSYITINSVTHDRRNYYLAFCIGVQITEIESWVLRLLGETRNLTHYDRSILNYTVNIGPTSPHWQFPIRGQWTITTLAEFQGFAAEVSQFVRDLALPFVDEHRDPLAIRRTLIDAPGHATNIWPYRPLLAIDCLYGSPEQTETDIALLNQRYVRLAPQPQKDFDKFVSAVRKALIVEQGVTRNSGCAGQSTGL
jgi:hypothetical protein